MSTRRYLLRVGRPGGLGLLEVIERFLLKPIRERLVARLVLLAGLAEILPLGLRLLVLGEKLLLDLGGSRLGPGGRGDREDERGGDGADEVSHGFPPWCAVRLLAGEVRARKRVEVTAAPGRSGFPVA